MLQLKISESRFLCYVRFFVVSFTSVSCKRKHPFLASSCIMLAMTPGVSIMGTQGSSPSNGWVWLVTVADGDHLNLPSLQGLKGTA